MGNFSPWYAERGELIKSLFRSTLIVLMWPEIGVWIATVVVIVGVVVAARERTDAVVGVMPPHSYQTHQITTTDGTHTHTQSYDNTH